MSLATILIMLFFGIACLAALAAVGAIVYQLFQKLFRKKKPTSPNEVTNPPPQ
jgi:peptidoglycan/LPS O-acetylase OafA/YrhL